MSDLRCMDVCGGVSEEGAAEFWILGGGQSATRQSGSPGRCHRCRLGAGGGGQDLLLLLMGGRAPDSEAARSPTHHLLPVAHSQVEHHLHCVCPLPLADNFSAK